jgi:hypothetical protein
MKTLFSILVLAIGASSAVAQSDKPFTPPVAPDAACGSPTAQFDVKIGPETRPTAQPQDGKVLVYVVEDQQFKFVKDATVRVGLDGAWVGANRGNSYLAFSVEPGEHHLCADWQSSFAGRLLSLAKFTAGAGKIYYFRARTTGAKDERSALDLESVNSDEGGLLVSRAQPSISTVKKK